MAVTDDRVSRQKLLKRAGVGAAVLGAGSLISAATASANANPSLSCVPAGGCATGGLPNPADGACCFCFVTTEASCFSGQNVYCAGLPTCSNSGQCPAGWTCCPNTGCGAGGVCIPHCGYHGAHVFPCGGGAPSAGKTAAK